MARLLHALCVSIAVGTLLLQAQAPPQPAPSFGGYDAALLEALSWRPLELAPGPVTAVAGAPSRPHEYYAGAAGGRLWRVEDEGATLVELGQGAFGAAPIGAIAVAPGDREVVYVGSGRLAASSDFVAGEGLYRSDDRGETWQAVGLRTSGAIAAIAISPRDARTALVAATGRPFPAGPDRGVYRTTNGGDTWERVLFRDERTGARAVVIDSAEPERAYAVLTAVVAEGTAASPAPGDALYRSVDGGATWREITSAAGEAWADARGDLSLAVSGYEQSRIYACSSAAPRALAVSEDGGDSWRTAESIGLPLEAGCDALAGDARLRDTIYLVSRGKLYRSTDGGQRFDSLPSTVGSPTALWVSPEDPRRLAFSGPDGAGLSINGGRSWLAIRLPSATVRSLAVTVDGTVCGLADSAGIACHSRAPADEWELPGFGGGRSLLAHPSRRKALFVGEGGGVVAAVDLEARRRALVGVWTDVGVRGGVDTERFVDRAPLALAEPGEGRLLLGSQHLWSMPLDTRTWQRTSRDLTRAYPSVIESGGERVAALTTVAASPVNPSILWAGSDDGLVHVTRDGGLLWEPATPPELGELARILAIVASRHRERGAYLVTLAGAPVDASLRVFRTSDLGASWLPIASGLPEGEAVRVLREDPERPGLLYAGTDGGVYVSFNDGAHWQSLSLSLPPVAVVDLVTDRHDLLLSARGRGVLVLDRIGAVRQLTSEVAVSALHVFRPAPGTRAPRREVVIDYVAAPSRQRSVVEILDASGQIVRRLDPAARDRVPADAGGPDRVRLHRVVWNLRYGVGAAVLAGADAGVLGPLAAPGTYQVRVTVGELSRIVPFTIDLDGPADVTAQDLQEQFELGRDIAAAMQRTRAAALRVQHVLEQIGERLAGPVTPLLTERGGELREALLEFGEPLCGGDLRNAPCHPEQTVLQQRLDALRHLTDRDDARPASDARTVLDDLAARADDLVSRLDTLLSSRLEAFNALLRQADLPPIAEPSGPGSLGAGQPSTTQARRPSAL